MTSNNKILTVSYGTFSCTLEGFEDNFGTMKAIAEYFRDLAADDRYFGAEPPQPDAEMLTRIAEREIARRVEARQHEGRIVLSASDAPAAAVPAAAVTAAAAAAIVDPAPVKETAKDQADTSETDAQAGTPDAIQADAAPEVTEAVAAQEAAQTTPAQEAAQTTPAQDEAQTLPAPEVAEAVATPDTADTAEADAALETVETNDTKDSATPFEEAPADPAPVEDAAASDAQDVVADTAVQDVVAEAAAQEVVADEIEDDADTTDDDAMTEYGSMADVDTFMFAKSDEDASQDSADTAEPVAAETPAPPAAPAAESIAAKLQRIRAVVSKSQQDSAEQELFEDEHADALETDADAPHAFDDGEEASTDVVAQAAQDIEQALEIDDAAEAGRVEDPASAKDDDALNALMARLDADDTAPKAEIAPEPADAASDAASQTEDNLFVEAEAPQHVAEDADLQAVEPSPTEEAEKPRPRARVIKVKRADIDAALASGQLEQIEEDGTDQDADQSAETANSTLSAEEEAELMAELAQVEAELPTQNDSQTTHAVAGEATETEEEAAAPSSETPRAETRLRANAADTQPKNVPDEDVSRLMAEADNQMEEPEASNRRDAFAHLKAAVKAKKADADIGSDSVKDEGAFRSDLAEVVKPRRPEVNAVRDERPDVARPAPLKLVAAQRVDTQQPVKGPVRPRRVEAAQEGAAETQGGTEGFAEYAAKQGAHDLPALLEAAASYLSFVEGRDEFSRPQLMTKVRQIEANDFSREDSLRSFGQLLRAGKIEKIHGGRFAVTSDIGYKPEERAAG